MIKFWRIKGNRGIIYLCLFSYLAFNLLARNFGLNPNFSYLVEFFSIILLFRSPYLINKTGLSITFGIMIALYFTSFLGAILNLVNPFNFAFGFRAQFLTMVIMFASASYLTIKDYHRIFHLLYQFQYINLAFSIFQLVVYGATGDINNGAFLSGAGQDIFCGALMTYYFYLYNKKLVKLYKLIFVLASSFFMAVVQDERFIFIEAGIILFYFTLANGINVRKIFTAMVLLAAILAGFSRLSEGQNQTMNSTSSIINYASQTGGGYNLPRLGSEVIIQQMFFDNPIKTIFGVGLGKAVETKLSFLDTSFYDKFGYLNYNWFSSQYIFLQTGWLGFILYVGFFVSLLFYNFQAKKRAPLKYRYLYDIAITFSLLCIMLIWYNPSLRLYYGIFPFFILGFGPCATKQLNKDRLYLINLKKNNE